MARISASMTPDLLLLDKCSQQNHYDIKGVDPGGGDENIDDDERDEVKEYFPYAIT